MRPERRGSLFWRRPLVPASKKCHFTTVAVSPTTISNDSLSVQMKSVSRSVLNFLLSWSPPMFLNGELERYEICIGEEEMDGSEDCSQSSDCFFLHSSENELARHLLGCTPLGAVSSSQQPSVDIGYHVVAGTEQLFLQVTVQYIIKCVNAMHELEHLLTVQ